eukprot:10062667-Prorocentrum_lima.AAC.1
MTQQQRIAGGHSFATMAMVKSGPHGVFETIFISMRAHVVHGAVNGHLLTVEYVPSADNPAYDLQTQ